MIEWLYVEIEDKFLSEYDGDTYTVKEAQCDILCKRCYEWIETWDPYARGTWNYSKFHITCAKWGPEEL